MAEVPQNDGPRSPNCWILYRQHNEPIVRQQIPGIRQIDISKVLSAWWKVASDDFKEPYRERARDLRDQHKIVFPNHVYNAKKQARKSSGKSAIQGDNQVTKSKTGVRVQTAKAADVDFLHFAANMGESGPLQALSQDLLQPTMTRTAMFDIPGRTDVFAFDTNSTASQIDFTPGSRLVWSTLDCAATDDAELGSIASIQDLDGIYSQSFATERRLYSRT